MTQQEPVEAKLHNPLDDELERAHRQIGTMLQLVRKRQDELLMGAVTTDEVAKTINDFIKVLVPLERLKEKLDDQNREEQGIGASGYALDLDEARVRVTGCLRRLKRCCRERADD